MNKLGRTFLLAAAAALSIHCAPVDDEWVEEEGSELASSASSLVVTSLPNLTSGTKTNLATMWGAEGQMFTSDGRLLVTGDKGVFELKEKADGTYERITLVGEQRSPSCLFGGITEVRDTLYVNCYAFGQSYLFAAPLNGSLPFRSILTLNIAVANGLTSDAQGRLYVADTWGGKIWRLIPAANDPFTIATRDTWRNPGELVNGIAHHAGSIYWTNGFQIKRNVVDPKPEDRDVVLVALGVFDDLTVDAAGILVADPGNATVVAYPLAGGAPLSTSKKSFGGASSVGRALKRAGFCQDDIIVTERSGNRVSVYKPL